MGGGATSSLRQRRSLHRSKNEGERRRLLELATRQFLNQIGSVRVLATDCLQTLDFQALFLLFQTPRPLRSRRHRRQRNRFSAWRIDGRWFALRLFFLRSSPFVAFIPSLGLLSKPACRRNHGRRLASSESDRDRRAMNLMSLQLCGSSPDSFRVASWRAVSIKSCGGRRFAF